MAPDTTVAVTSDVSEHRSGGRGDGDCRSDPPHSPWAELRTATYAYDGQGRGTLTEGADGTDHYTVAYSETATHVIRTVVNPLGRSTTYRFQKFSSTVPDNRLVAV